MLLNENLILRNCPALLANSIEFNGMKANSKEQAAALQAIKNNDMIKDLDLIPKVTNKIGRQTDLKSLCIILGHLFRLPEVEKECLKDDVEFILGKAPYLIHMMVETAI